MEDSKKRLWIGTYAGVNLFERGNGNQTYLPRGRNEKTWYRIQ